MRIGVLGSGLVGGFVGGALARAGHDVVLVGRPSFVEAATREGFRLSDLEGMDARVPPAAVRAAVDPAALADRDVVLVTVKGLDTAAAAAQARPHLRPGAVVVSLQNGVRNPEVIREALGPSAARVLGGLVTFNVVRRGDLHLERTTTGPIVVEDDGAVGREVAAALSRAGLPARAEPDVAAVQWGKLLFNLNNAVNALCGLPLGEEIADPGYRRVYAACFDEGLSALARAGVRPRAPMRAPIAAVPRVLRLPSPLFRLVARRFIGVGAGARSSMWDDLERRRPTEVDLLNGEIVALARAQGRDAPANAAVVEAIRRAEQAGRGSPRMTAAEMLRLCASPSRSRLDDAGSGRERT